VRDWQIDFLAGLRMMTDWQADWLAGTDVAEECIASIFKVEE
jgi:hypothetical protein